MVVWSATKPLLTSPILRNILRAGIQRNMSDHRILPLQPSKWQWTKFKDYLHFYMMLGIIPCTGIIILSNIFVGPATLSEIPEDYVPKHWEYYRSPVTRFIARYILDSPQQNYEKFLHHLFEEDEKMRIRQVESAVKAKMEERHDYQAYYYRPVLGKYHRMSKDASDYLAAIRGD